VTSLSSSSTVRQLTSVPGSMLTARLPGPFCSASLVSPLALVDVAREALARWMAAFTRSAATWFVVDRNAASDSGVYDHSRYCVEVRYLSSSFILPRVYEMLHLWE
jgi:hypothetical protein